MKIEIRPAPFDPWFEVQRYQQERFADSPEFGATAVFVGTMRDVNDGDRIRALRLEHYPAMTERHLRRIADEASERWTILDGLILHRVGDLLPADPIVLVAVWSSHRAAAFAACRFLIDDLKSRAPFWKKETLDVGSRWVEMNT